MIDLKLPNAHGSTDVARHRLILLGRITRVAEELQIAPAGLLFIEGNPRYAAELMVLVSRSYDAVKREAFRQAAKDALAPEHGLEFFFLSTSPDSCQ
jgi:hypothetical protein